MMSHRDNQLFWLMYFFIIRSNNFPWKIQLFWLNLSKVIVLFIYFVFPQTKRKTPVVINAYGRSEKQWITLDLLLVVQVWRHKLASSLLFFQFIKPNNSKTKQDFWMQFFGKVLVFYCSATYLLESFAFSSPLIPLSHGPMKASNSCGDRSM